MTQSSSPSISPNSISYASSGRSRAERIFIRTLENLTGRQKLLRRARRHLGPVPTHVSFWEEMVRLFGLKLNITKGALDLIPENGPLLLVSNHPFGILDGLFMGYILSATRPDFRILANDVFAVAPQITDIILPVSFDATADAVRTNLATRKTAIGYLNSGGAIGVFPGGTVSTSLRPFGLPADPGWRSFTAKLISKTDPTIVPIFFDGQNSRRFQVLSRVHSSLRLGLMINEFKRRIDDHVDLCIGTPLKLADLGDVADNGHAIMDALRARTYDLSGSRRDYGYEFEPIHKRNQRL